MSGGQLVANHYSIGPQSSTGARQNNGGGVDPVGAGPQVRSEFAPLETNNWLLHLRYVRGEHDMCKRLADVELQTSRGYSEYANYVMGLIFRIEGQIHKSLEYFSKCSQLNPSNVENIRQVARSLFLLGKSQQAIEKYTEAMKLCPSDWNIFHSLGLCYMQMTRFEEAELNLIRAVELGHTEESHTALARLYMKMSDPAKAVSAYKTAFLLFPSNPETAVELGLLYLELGEFQKAFDAWGTALSHEPTNPRALLAIGAEFQRNEDFDIALAKYKLSAQSLPESSFLWNNIGMCFFSKRKYVAAISCLKRAIYLSPLDWKALYNLGLVHMHTKQLVSAFHFSSASVKANPLHGPTFLLLALALYNLSDETGARKAFDQAIKLSPDSSEIRVNLALFLKHLGEMEEAKDQVEIVYGMAAAAVGERKLDPQLEEILRLTFEDASTMPAQSLSLIQQQQFQRQRNNGIADHTTAAAHEIQEDEV